MNTLPVPVPRKNTLPAQREEDYLSEFVGAFESETTDVIQRLAPRSERTIQHVLMLMLATAVALSAVVKLDRVITGGGSVVAAGGSIYVSPLNAGIVREIEVKVGDIVKKGQVLATLDQTLTKADVAQLQQKLGSDQATLERLQAEYERKPYRPSKADSFSEVQMAIHRQRQAEYTASLASFDAKIGGGQALVAQYRRDSEQYKERSRLASNVESMYAPLAKKGYVSKLQLMSAQDTKEEMRRLYGESQNQISAREQEAESLRAQKNSFIENWRADASQQLVTIRDSVNATRENLEKAEKLVSLSVLTSPNDAIVLKIGRISEGSVANSLSDSSALFTLVPLDAKLEAEMKVRSEDIGFVRTGDKVTMKLEAYPFIRHGTAEGIVKTVSEGSFTLDENNAVTAPYFKVRVAITEAKLRNVPDDFRLIPGMTLSGDLLLGKRTILSYLIMGVMRTGSEAMREAR